MTHDMWRHRKTPTYLLTYLFTYLLTYLLTYLPTYLQISGSLKYITFQKILDLF